MEPLEILRWIFDLFPATQKAAFSYAGLFYVTWILFVFVMAVKARWARMHIVAKVMAAPAAVVGVVFDAVLNVATGAALFLAALAVGRWRPDHLDPRDIMLTNRLEHCIAREPDSQCGRWSRFICAVLLDPFEEGGHCKPKK